MNILENLRTIFNISSTRKVATPALEHYFKKFYQKKLLLRSNLIFLLLSELVQLVHDAGLRLEELDRQVHQPTARYTRRKYVPEN